MKQKSIVSTYLHLISLLSPSYHLKSVSPFSSQHVPFICRLISDVIPGGYCGYCAALYLMPCAWIGRKCGKTDLRLKWQLPSSGHSSYYNRKEGTNNVNPNKCCQLWVKNILLPNLDQVIICTQLDLSLNLSKGLCFSTKTFWSKTWDTLWTTMVDIVNNDKYVSSPANLTQPPFILDSHYFWENVATEDKNYMKNSSLESWPLW